jgi:taurine dioxygenase
MPQIRTVGPRPLRRTADGVESKPYERFELIPRGVTIGGEIRGVRLDEPVDAELFSELNRALLEWKVLFFRDQDITAEQHIDFAKHWGSLEIHPALVPGAIPEIVRFEKGGENRNAVDSGYENTWHSDVSWRPEPSLGSLLRCIACPEMGGDTLFADMYAAYDQLSDDLRERIAGLTAQHSFSAAFGKYLGPEKMAELMDKHPDQTHPIVRTHPETGRRLLYVNVVFTQSVNGLSFDESEALLDELLRYSSIPEIQTRWSWRPNDVAFWDDRATQHYACSDYFPKRRVMERVTVCGDRPF